MRENNGIRDYLKKGQRKGFKGQDINTECHVTLLYRELSIYSYLFPSLVLVARKFLEPSWILATLP
jgi:hypothetical protein